MTQEITADLRDRVLLDGARNTPDRKFRDLRAEADRAAAALRADVERTVADVLHPAPLPEARGGAVWPRNAYADWCPQPVPTEPPVANMTALTVFTTYTVPTPPGTPPQYAAACVCGDEWNATSEALMRQQLGEHRCAEQLGRPAPLLPASRDVAEATDDMLGRLLDGLRDLS